MRALITGISGFVGSHLAEYLLAHTDWQIAGTIHRSNIAIASPSDTRLKTYPADLSRLPAVSFVLEEVEPDYVFHLAAQPLVSLSQRDPWGTLEPNIRMQLNILEAVAAQCPDCRVLVVGSSEEYGLVRPEDLPVKETTPFRPTSPYAVSKVAQDLLGLQYHLTHGLNTIRVRPFNHIGPRQRLGFVAPDFAQQVAAAEAGLQPPIVRVGNLDVSRDFSDVRDVVRGYHLAITQGEPGEVYNLGAERAHTVREMLETFLAMSTLSIKVEQDADRLRPADMPMLVSDCTKLRERTGWRAVIPFEQSLRDVLNYWREQVRAGATLIQPHLSHAS